MTSDPELCRRVAEACGCRPNALYNGTLWDGPDGLVLQLDADPEKHNDSECEWKPDVDWNDAMQAAEWFGLFQHSKGGMSLTCDRGNCVIYDAEEFYMRDGSYFAENSPGTRAICEAILKLKG